MKAKFKAQLTIVVPDTQPRPFVPGYLLYLMVNGVLIGQMDPKEIKCVGPKTISLTFDIHPGWIKYATIVSEDMEFMKHEFYVADETDRTNPVHNEFRIWHSFERSE
jgi:hypothetical protein